MSTFLLIIGDREALGWILDARRTAFPGAGKGAHRAEVRSLKIDDELMVYTTRGAFKNSTRDRGRVIGTARVTSDLTQLDQPVFFGGRGYPVGCDLELETLVPFGSGVNLAEHVSQLDALKDLGDSWSLRLRRPLLRISERDSKLLREQLLFAGTGIVNDEVVSGYSKWYRAQGSDSGG
ncbi:hypothetical protein [Mycolicibacterium tusciae]|uniref:EVE domain-containing protein n=1 Tax=Mycolicibacterium tusciae TaxID=75922 RepID=A0A1X0K392_9MYCO|nr:hypothetical protein [Mycolicibacterium tusciae]ORB68946.1 hypothetical protein BST47_02630 [Mycolicibacterium tusciae]